MSTTDDIRELAGKLLRDRQVDLVIGYERGTLPMRRRPAFVRSEAEAERLIWDRWCELDLARYLPFVVRALARWPEKGLKPSLQTGQTAIVAKACDVRAIVGCLKEKQMKREDVVIIGVRCEGLLDRNRVQEILKGRRLREAVAEGDSLILRGDGFEERVPCRAVLREECGYCTSAEPVEADYVLGLEVKPREIESEYADIEEIEKRLPEERWQWFCEEIDKCIRCYACRNACPMCYCGECFVESSSPEWVGKGDDLPDKQFFHIMRAFHTAGRCVDCGACERACPMGIRLRILTRKIQKDVKDLFGAEAGKDLDSLPALAAFEKDDPDDFTE